MFKLFSKNGDFIGTIEEDGDDGSGGLLTVVIVLVIIFLGVIAWPSLFKSVDYNDAEEIVSVLIILTTTIGCSVINYKMNSNSINGVAAKFVANMIRQTLISTAVFVVAGGLDFANLFMFLFMSFLLSFIPSIFIALIAPKKRKGYPYPKH